LKKCDELYLPPLASGIVRKTIGNHKKLDVSGYNLGDRYIQALANGLYYSEKDPTIISLSKNGATERSIVPFIE